MQGKRYGFKYAYRLVLNMLVLVLFATNARAETKLTTRHTMDYFSTISSLYLYVEEGKEGDFERTWTKVKETLAEIESAVSVSEPSSDIARFNALPCGGEISVSPITAELFRTAQEVYNLTDGMYDPTIYPSVDLWGFTPRFNSYFYAPSLPYDRTLVNGRLPLPDAKHIEALLPLVGLDGIHLEERDGQVWLRKETPPIEIDGVVIQAQLDLGGIAKGYACDRVISLLRESGFTQGHFVCGGSSLSVMSRPSEDGMYELTLTKPRQTADKGQYFATVRIRDIGVSTSVDVSQSFREDGVTYCHIIDPRTGWPINMPNENGVQFGLAGATLLGENATLCDGLTTALLVMGPDAAMDFLREREEKNAALVAFRSDEDVLTVLGDMPGLTIRDEAYILAENSD
ncbi:MAG: FAD:protein FMN transferase [Blautia sp.]|nr:FAD:protein FMN transferase [Blautia sp.]